MPRLRIQGYGLGSEATVCGPTANQGQGLERQTNAWDSLSELGAQGQSLEHRAWTIGRPRPEPRTQDQGVGPNAIVSDKRESLDAEASA